MTTCRRPAWGRVQAWAFRCRSLSAHGGRHRRLLPLRHPRRRLLLPLPLPLRPRPRPRPRRGRIFTAALTTNASTSTSGRGSTTRLAPKYAAREQCNRVQRSQATVHFHPSRLGGVVQRVRMRGLARRILARHSAGERRRKPPPTPTCKRWPPRNCTHSRHRSVDIPFPQGSAAGCGYLGP